MPGENVTQDDIIFFRGQFLTSAEEMAVLKKKRKLLRQRAKLAGIEVEVLDQVIKLEDEDDDTTLARFQTFQRYAQFNNLPIGSQISFFGEARDMPKHEPDYDKAWREGREHGLMGRNRDHQAYPPLSELGMRYDEGYDDGQRELGSRLKMLDDGVAGDEQKRPRGRPKGSKTKVSEGGESAEGSAGETSAAETAEA